MYVLDFCLYTMAEVSIQISVEAQTSFLQNAFRLRSDQCYCDIEIHIGNTSCSAHKLILVSYSKYFADYFRLLNSNQSHIMLPDMNWEMFSYILDYMYGQEIKIPVPCWDEFLKAAKKLEIPDLLDKWDTGQRRGLKTEGVLDITCKSMTSAVSTPSFDIKDECNTLDDGDEDDCTNEMSACATRTEQGDVYNVLGVEESLKSSSGSLVGMKIDITEQFTTEEKWKPLEDLNILDKTCSLSKFSLPGLSGGSEYRGKYTCVTCKSIFPNITEKSLHYLARSCSGGLLKVARQRFCRNFKKESRRKIPVKTNIPSHVCYTCFKGFISKSALLRHFQLNHKKKSLWKFPSSQVRDRKNTAAATKSKNIPFPLKIPSGEGRGSEFTLDEITRGLNRCEQCGNVFANEKALVMHRVKTHGLGVFLQAFHCPNCPQEFNVKEFYRWHHIRKHKKYIQVCSEEECDFTCTTIQDITNHLKKEHNTDPPHKCPFCNYVTPLKGYLKRHIDRHFLRGKLYICELCSKVYMNEKRLLQHKYSHHGLVDADKVVRCTYQDCSFLTYSSVTMENHCRAKHTEEKNFPCPQCNKRLSTKRSLHAHILSRHELRYTCNCPNCGKMLIDKAALKLHQLRCTRAPKTFLCTQCDHSSYAKGELEAHQFKKHGILPSKGKIYSCELCDYTCTMKCTLSRHMRIHTGERPEVCDICGKKFPIGSLRAHMKVHNTTYDFQCMYCDYKTQVGFINIFLLFMCQFIYVYCNELIGFKISTSSML
ncbi:zinc finger protein 26 isoform X1 [Lingula anatina]|uniref:Zinc finger protein 26 isoform X1 n=2 Tax=Lingula anatina TaxID=7574 RepID=A0A1S3K0S7_LINAN|nr:zinc finger protein 26 isoform X1 [Lingula anatina]|eukprot:XP_013416137.1 zinc finger protein 26 isoform X1 [Lingula anatina]